MKRNCRRLQRMGIPNTLENVEDIKLAFQNEKIMEVFGMSMEDEPKQFYRVAVEESSYSYCIFSSQSMIDLIKNHIAIERRRFLMDATFKIVPKSSFYQLLIIYVEYVEKVSIFMVVLFP